MVVQSTFVAGNVLKDLKEIDYGERLNLLLNQSESSYFQC